MNIIKVDETKAIHLEFLRPGDCYEPEIVSADEIKLHRVMDRSSGKMTKEEVLVALEKSPLSFTKSWDELKRETRDPV